MMSLHSKAIKKLEELGVSEELWLIELSTFDTMKKFYPDRQVDDLTQYAAEEDDHIIYYHESGSIHKHETFNADSEESFNEAVENIAKYFN